MIRARSDEMMPVSGVNGEILPQARRRRENCACLRLLPNRASAQTLESRVARSTSSRARRRALATMLLLATAAQLSIARLNRKFCVVVRGLFLNRTASRQKASSLGVCRIG